MEMWYDTEVTVLYKQLSDNNRKDRREIILWHGMMKRYFTIFIHWD